jgi:aspartate/methionine/tyrosine aminotransferase
MSSSSSFGIRELAERAKAVQALDLTQGTIDAPPPAILPVLLQHLPPDRASRYTNKRGVPEYREAVQHHLQERRWPVPLDGIIATSGVSGALTSALLAHARPGATVILPEPFFIGHRLLLEALGFQIRYLPVPLDGAPHWHEIEQALASADACIITTPANPTGQVASLDTLTALSEAAARSQCLLFIDEMYREFIWEHPPADDARYVSLNLTSTVVARSFSKTFAIPGWRIGFAITSPARVELMAKIHDALYLGGTTLAQYVLAEALTQHSTELMAYVTSLRHQLQANQQALAGAFTQIGMKPLLSPATYYLMIAHQRKDDLVATEELLGKKIAVVPLRILYADTTQPSDYIRIHFAIDQTKSDEVCRLLTA